MGRPRSEVWAAEYRAEEIMRRNSSGDLVGVLVGGFERWLQAYEEQCPFKKAGQLEYHVETIRLRRALGSAKAALQDEAFLASLHRTLQAWGIGLRASRLRPLKRFSEALQDKAETICGLDGVAIDQQA